jgi:putative hemolysin
LSKPFVHRDYRNGATINALWSGIAHFVAKQRVDSLIGCVSIPLRDNGAMAQDFFSELVQQRSLTPDDLQV